MSSFTYTQARANLATLMDEVTLNNEIIIITRKNSRAVAMISEDELRSLKETAHLLSSPKNAERLLTALARARSEKIKPMNIEELKKEIGLE
jgi:antitoxin YefM